MALAPKMFCALVISALLQTVTSRDVKENIYLVTVSSQVVGGSSETLCVQVHGPEPRSLRVVLQPDHGSNSILLDEKRVAQGYYRCLLFQVPAVVSETVATLHVRVSERHVTMHNKTKILIRPPTFINLIQTDKPIYKPGQKVQFRIVSLDSSFVPYNQRYQTVELEDPNSNRIAQWLNQSTVSGILDLAHPTTPEAAQGHYIITAWNEKGQQHKHTFEIKEYVLPKYEVKVHLPSVITILDTQATLRVCGKYTYGKPVMGFVKATVCRKAWIWFWGWFGQNRPTDICKKYEMMMTDKTGCATQVLDVTQFALSHTMFEDTFQVETEMEEHGTGVVLKGSGSAKFTSIIRTVKFEDIPAAYKSGIAYQGKIKVTGPDSPAAYEAVQLLTTDGELKEHLNLVTDGKGLVRFSLDTSLWTSGVSLQAKSGLAVVSYAPGLRQPEYRSAYHHPTAFYSKSKSFLKLQQTSQSFSCETDAAVDATYIIQGEELNKGQVALDFFYMVRDAINYVPKWTKVMSRGSVVQHGYLPVAVEHGTVNRGWLSVPLRSMADLSPYAQVVVYTVMPGGEVVADSMDFPIQLCLKNKVSLQFCSPQELPGGKTSLSLQAQPGSLCSIRAIDQSVLLLKPERELSLASVFGELPVQKLSGYPYTVEDREPYPCLPEPQPAPPSRGPEPAPPSRKKRFYFGPNNKNDVYSIFREVGIKILTNSDVKEPFDCNAPIMAYAPMAEPMAMPDAAEGVKKTVRTYFPETWIWDLVPVGESGSVSLKKTVPDTITKWAAGAFCTSSVGLGLAPNIGLTAFQPFFLSLTLPYSVIRGEVFTLRATVFNYLSKCIMVKVTTPESTQFSTRLCEGNQLRICLCADESRTFEWYITPTTLGEVSINVSAEALQTEDLCGNEVATVPKMGRIDTVVRSLLVEAQGTQETESHNALLCPAGAPVEREISLQLPKVFVEGSVKASVSVLGDLMGRAMKNLDSLLAMPYGCGEQNMVRFAPNIYILTYLQSTGQLSPEIRDKATHFLESGYQRELTYKHDDGSYSAFGKSDESGNTWLTTFVMKSFGGARSYIYVDPIHITKAKSWLASHQRPDCCFASVGKLFNNGMKGGVSDDVSLTAYITAALLELGDNANIDPLVEQSLGCLKTELTKTLDNLYTIALLSYTFTLAGDQHTRSKLISYLHQRAKTTADSSLHWERAEASGKRLDSIAVEITSYVLLALLSGPAMDGFGLDYSSRIVRWLAQQQNPNGGFSSTQDTVVALQALAKYSAVTYSPEYSSTVVVISASGLRQEFKVDEHNRLLYQEEPLVEVPGVYKIKAEGKSCVFLQMALRFNIPPPQNFAVFRVTSAVLGTCTNVKPVLMLNVVVRYNGRREETNMVVIDVKLLSGFVMNSLVSRDPNVKRVIKEEGHVIIYLDGLKRNQSQSYTLVIQQDVAVRNLKPAVIKVYDYYQTSDEAVTKYSSPCA